MDVLEYDMVFSLDWHWLNQFGINWEGLSMVIQDKKKKLEYILYSIPNQSTLDASYLNN